MNKQQQTYIHNVDTDSDTDVQSNVSWQNLIAKQRNFLPENHFSNLMNNYGGKDSQGQQGNEGTRKHGKRGTETTTDSRKKKSRATL